MRPTALRIDGTGRPTAPAGRASVRGAGPANSFQIGQQPAQTAAPANSPAIAATGLAALLALQAVDDPVLAKRKSVRRGRSMLDVLETIKADLLVGGIGEGRLNQLMALVTQARERSEPGLDALIDDIELRVLVELAKLGRYPQTV